MNVELQGVTIEVSEEKKTYCLMYRDFLAAEKIVSEEFEKNYKKYGSLEKLAINYDELVEHTVESIYYSVDDLLKKYTRRGVGTADEFIRLFGDLIDQKLECYGDYFYNKYEDLDEQRTEAREFRERRKANRKMWYGLNKAGQSEANSKNFQSWMVHSARNAVGNTVTNVSTNSKMSGIYNDKNIIKKQKEAVAEIFNEVFAYFVNLIKNNEKSPIEIISADDLKRSKENYKLLQTSEIGSAKNLEEIKNVVEATPNRKEIYEYIIENYGDTTGNISAFATEFGIDLSSWKIMKVEEKLKQDKTNDLSSEKKILDAIAAVEKDCEHYNVKSETYTADLRILWEKLDQKLRIVEGKQYESRRESEAVRKDISYLWEYSMQNNMLGENFDLQSVVEEISANVKTEAVKSNLPERINNLAAWQNLKNIQHASMEIASACPVYDKIKGELWFGDIFSYGKAFESLRELFADNNKNAVLYDNGTMSKGKTGLLFTSNGIYFYSKDGIVSIWLEEYEGMELNQGEIIIHRKNEDVIKTGIRIKIEQLNSFMICELFDTIVLMCRAIKNKDQNIDDTEVYFTVSREKSNKKVNKEDLTQEDRQLLLGKKIWIGILIVVAAVIFMFIFGKGKQDSTPTTSTNVENITTDETKDEITTPVQPDTVEDTYSDEIVEDADIAEADENDAEERTPFLVQGLDPYYYEKTYTLYSDDGNGYADLTLNLVDESGIYGEYSIYSYDEGIICSGELLGGWAQEVKDKIEASNENGTFDLWFQDNETVILQWNDIKYEEADYSNDDLYSEYILPDSDSVYIQTSTLEDLTAEQCKLARNEIYARHGRRFNDESIQEYFDQCSWYEGTIAPEDFSDDVLNDYEITNLQTISTYEENKGYK